MMLMMMSVAIAVSLIRVSMIGAAAFSIPPYNGSILAMPTKIRHI